MLEIPVRSAVGGRRLNPLIHSLRIHVEIWGVHGEGSRGRVCG